VVLELRPAYSECDSWPPRPVPLPRKPAPGLLDEAIGVRLTAAIKHVQHDAVLADDTEE
jgi:hypothetical protein